MVLHTHSRALDCHPHVHVVLPAGAIDPATRTARVDPQSGQGALFDMELLEAGTAFDLRWELALPAEPGLQTLLRQALAIALTGFERGEIGLGARKRRGLGECRARDEAEAAFRRVIGVWQRTGNDESKEMAETLEGLARVLRREGRTGEAVALEGRARELRTRVGSGVGLAFQSGHGYAIYRF